MAWDIFHAKWLKWQKVFIGQQQIVLTNRVGMFTSSSINLSLKNFEVLKTTKVKKER